MEVTAVKGVEATTDSAAVEAYVRSFPDDVRGILGGIRRTIRVAASTARERIKYKILAFTLDDYDLIHVAAWKRYVSVYPTSVKDEALERDLSPYRADRATVRFPLAQPVPHELIARPVQRRADQRPNGGGVV